MNETFVKVDKKDGFVALAHIIFAFFALLLGGSMGLLQVLVRSGKMTMPFGLNYYQVLTVHGVILALVLTTFFIIGFQYAGMSRTVGTFSKRGRTFAWVGFITMSVGTLLALYSILKGDSSVLYTFYAPLKAGFEFYVGLALLVVGSWISGFVKFTHYYKWKKVHPGESGPLLGFMIVTNMAMWLICTLGVAATVLLQFIPLAAGWTDSIDVLVSRTLFWYFGHPLVYFWLLPAYMVWYVVIPKILGTKLFSDSLARVSFILFLFFSIPVGFHHQLTEPGIDSGWKFVQVILTMMVVIPSLMTAFSMFATFEKFGRLKGGKGLFGWFKHLPWGDARFLIPFIGMVFFIPAGAGGIINASNQLNTLVHNTIWVTGHFHLTVATTVLLTFFGAAYWLIPHLTGRIMTKAINRLAIIQGIVWTTGMVIMSGAMHWAGLLGAPRRSDFSTYGGTEQATEWIGYQMAQAIGGSILYIGIILILYIVFHLLFLAPKGQEEFPIGEMEENAPKTPLFLDKWWLWVAIVVILVFLAYAIPFGHMIHNPAPPSPGYRFW